MDPLMLIWIMMAIWILIVNNINGPAFIYRNNAETQLNNHYLSCCIKRKRLEHTSSRDPASPCICNGQELIAEQYATRGFMSATSNKLHFGLGSVNEIDSLVVRWPDRSRTCLIDVQADQVITLEMEKAGEAFNENEKANEHHEIVFPGPDPWT